MKERFIGVGLGVGAALILGAVCTDSAQAFSLTKTVNVENFLRDPETLNRVPYTGDVKYERGPVNVVIGSDPELTRFGGLWDIDLGNNALGNNSIRFTLTSQLQFNSVISGDDVYSFLASGFGGLGETSLTGATFVPLGNSALYKKNPVIKVLADNWLEVVFPQGFAQDLAFVPKGGLDFRIDLTVKQPTPVPAPIPTPALLPGLVGMGLAAWRRHGSNQDD